MQKKGGKNQYSKKTAFDGLDASEMRNAKCKMQNAKCKIKYNDKIKNIFPNR